LNDQINPINIKKKELAPLFDIRLDIGSNGLGVTYEPEIQEIAHSNTISVRNVIKNWINDFFNVANVISRLDTTVPGDYL